jgi:hydroxymethylglutaryl-CoA lyase
VPQMSDSDAVCARIARKDGVTYSGLALNAKGVERAAAAGLQAVDISVSASETHSKKNANKTLAEAQADFARMVAIARASHMRGRGGIQCAFGCVYEGWVDPHRVLEIARAHLDLGVDELALADSTGMANPRQLQDLVGDVARIAGETPIVLHLHDTRGLGLPNVLAALEVGVSRFDTAFGGLGGCPFIKGATGNIATEDTANMLEQMGIRTGVDLAKIAACSQQIQAFLGRRLDGKLYRLAAGG